MAYLNGNPQLQSLNSIIKFHLEVCWGALSKSGVIDPEIRSHSLSVCVWHARCCHRSSKLILALPMRSSCLKKCFLCISMHRSFPSTSMLHRMNVYDYPDTRYSTHHLLWVSSKRCSPLMVLPNFPLTRSRGRLGLSEYLTTSGRENPLSSCPMNSEIDCNHISMMVDWTDRVGLTDNSNGLCRKRVVSWLWILDGVSRKGVTTQSCDTDHRSSCLGNLDMSREFDHWHSEADIGVTWIECLYRCLMCKSIYFWK